ncbi:hypothetical protein TELCIR_20165 [Teladorsagia circumcincta]|uniref:ribonuclease Z n=1 Tax=Teladorsagia circumcincta TaxID=45464 RepID=A0A2G9TKA7_TELCI|nr:hypothetical protein TELCIR_20165 [Teladorsagia circumcincta]
MNGLYTVIERRKEAIERAGCQYTPLVLVCNRNVLKPLKTYSMCFSDLESLVEIVDISRHPITPPASPGPPTKRRRLPSPVLSACRNIVEQMPRPLFDENSWNIQEIKAVQADALRKKHSTMGQAVEIGRKMRARNVILTHFSARYPKVCVYFFRMRFSF